MNDWTQKLLAASSHKLSLLERIHELFEQQRISWSLLRDGENALDTMKVKEYLIGGNRVVVQANAGRAASINAKVDPLSIALRPCFLCPNNLPQPERGISFGDYIVLPNPYPILKHHITIAFKDHVPQSIEPCIADFCDLVRAVGPKMFVIYNGPRCGASAPDHMHFQACDSTKVPLFEQLGLDLTTNQITPLTILGRNLLVCKCSSAQDARQYIQKALDALKKITGSNCEPMINIIALFYNGNYLISIFPRSKHRSCCYFAEPSRRISISPAAIEMAGIIVVADAEHFDRVNENVVLSIYEEVTLENSLFSKLIEALR